jgi:hypothetical protein
VESTDLGVDSKVGIPTVGWHDLADSELAGLVEDAADVGHRISKFGFSRAESRSFKQTVRPGSRWRVAR